LWYRLLKKIEAQARQFAWRGLRCPGRGLPATNRSKTCSVEAIRYGERPDVKAKLDQIVRRLDTEHLQELVYHRSLVHESLDPGRVREIRDQMERAQARRLQPHYIGSFFLRAFQFLGGSLHRRETNRYEISAMSPPTSGTATASLASAPRS